MFFWHPTGRLGWFRGDSCVPSGSEIYSSVPVRIRKGHTNGAHLPPPLNRAPGAPPPPPLFPLWNGSRELNFSGRRSSFLRWSRCICCPLFSQEASGWSSDRTASQPTPPEGAVPIPRQELEQTVHPASAELWLFEPSESNSRTHPPAVDARATGTVWPWTRWARRCT